MLFDVYAMFHDMDDPLNPTAMRYVQTGLLSDISGVPMYLRRASCRPVSKRTGVSAVCLEEMHLVYRASHSNVRTKFWHWDWNGHAAMRANIIPRIGVWLVAAIIDAVYGMESQVCPFRAKSVGANAHGREPAHHDRRPVCRAWDRR